MTKLEVEQDLELKQNADNQPAAVSRVMRAVRWALWIAIGCGIWFLGNGLSGLFSSGTVSEGPVTETADAPESEALLLELDASLLQGFWAVAEAPFGVSMKTVSHEQLQQELARFPAELSASEKDAGDLPSEFETTVLSLAAKLGRDTVDDATGGAATGLVRTGEYAGLHYRLVIDGKSHSRLRLAQVYWNTDDDQWGLAQVIPRVRLTSEDTHPLQEVQALLPDLGDPIATRLSSEGQVTGAVYQFELPFAAVRSQCAAAGLRFQTELENDDFLSGTITNDAKKQWTVILKVGSNIGFVLEDQVAEGEVAEPTLLQPFRLIGIGDEVTVVRDSGSKEDPPNARILTIAAKTNPDAPSTFDANTTLLLRATSGNESKRITNVVVMPEIAVKKGN